MKDVSILVPVFNEEHTLPRIMDALALRCGEAQIIYIDDGSRDRSLEILRQKARGTDVILTKENGGKGSAIRMGREHANRPFTIIQDADLEYDPGEIELLLHTARAHEGAIVFGSRFLKPNPNLYKRYLWGNKTLTAMVNILFGSRLTDSYTCYKLFPTRTLGALPLTAEGFELEAELTCLPLKRGMHILEVPISYAPRSLREGKKIRFSDAWKGMMRMLKIRFF